ncbi:acetylcholine receptor subunit alpha-L1-like [Haliotis rufescens]|uniref:acetylcholine receptor subunit alpha-L1-like n=1 Tax=Haliotis rufescens TaxID=6454 RepID=UPI00201EC36A|nr:acetylcholine receptor subunit alpha-L1-like [Haliotis rufescens]
MALGTAVLFVACLAAVQCQRYDPLYKELMSREAQHTIPVDGKDETLNVTINLTLLKLTSLNLRTGDAVLDTWVHYEWEDSRLAWDTSDYKGITLMNLPHSNIWTPDIVPYRGHTVVTDVPAVVHHSGLVYYIPPTIIKTRCDVSNYTTDGTVTCSLKIGSWTYSGNVLDIQNKGPEIDVSEYYHDDQWDIIEHSMQKRVYYYECCPDPYPAITASVTLKAKRHGLLGWSLFH